MSKKDLCKRGPRSIPELSKKRKCVSATGTPFPRESGTSLAPGLNTTGTTFLPDPSSSIRQPLKDQRKAFDIIAQVDLFHCSESDLSSLTEDQKFSWLIQRFGWVVVSRIWSALKSIPSVLTKAQRSRVFLAQCQKNEISVETATEIGEMLEDECTGIFTHFECETPKFLVLCPPISECPKCDSKLVAYHDCEVRVFTYSGVSTASKFSLRCKGCKLYFGYSQYGNKRELGFRYYCDKRPLIEVTDTVFMDRRLLEFQCCLA